MPADESRVCTFTGVMSGSRPVSKFFLRNNKAEGSSAQGISMCLCCGHICAFLPPRGQGSGLSTLAELLLPQAAMAGGWDATSKIVLQDPLTLGSGVTGTSSEADTEVARELCPFLLSAWKSVVGTEGGQVVTRQLQTVCDPGLGDMGKAHSADGWPGERGGERAWEEPLPELLCCHYDTGIHLLSSL